MPRGPRGEKRPAWGGSVPAAPDSGGLPRREDASTSADRPADAQQTRTAADLGHCRGRMLPTPVFRLIRKPRPRSGQHQLHRSTARPPDRHRKASPHAFLSEPAVIGWGSWPPLGLVPCLSMHDTSLTRLPRLPNAGSGQRFRECGQFPRSRTPEAMAYAPRGSGVGSLMSATEGTWDQI